MHGRDGHFAGSGGPDIFWQSWEPDGAARASLVIAHGAAEHGGRYAALAERLVDRGVAVYALDHRGHGRSAGRRSLIDRRERALADLGHLIDQAAAEHGGAPTFLLGHSMGGCFALAYALEDPRALAGLILSGPVVELETGRLLLGLSRILSVIAPRLGVFRVDAAAVSRDPEQVERYETDPLNHRGKLPVRTVAEMAGAVRSFRRRAPELELPLLILQGGADRIVPPSGAKMLAERAGSKDKTFKLYDGLYHEIFNEAEPERTAVVDDVLDWLGARLPPAPGRRRRPRLRRRRT